MVAGRHQHTSGCGERLGELVLDSFGELGVAALLLQEPRAVGDVAVLVLGDPLERLEVAREDPTALQPPGLEPLTRQSERALDHHVVDGDEVDLGLDAPGIRQKRPVRVDEMPVEQLHIVVVEVLSGAL